MSRAGAPVRGVPCQLGAHRGPLVDEACRVAVHEERGRRELRRERPQAHATGERECGVGTAEPDQGQHAGDAGRAGEAGLACQTLGERELTLRAPQPREVARPGVQVGDAGRPRARHELVGASERLVARQKPPRVRQLQHRERRERRIAGIGQPFGARQGYASLGGVALGDVHPGEVLEPGRELGLELEHCFEGCGGLAA